MSICVCNDIWFAISFLGYGFIIGILIFDVLKKSEQEEK